MSTSRFNTIIARMWLKTTSPEYNPSVLDYMPKDGLIGYTTNNPRLAFLLLSEPAERFGFHVKDFSTFGTSLDFEGRWMAVGHDQNKHTFNSMYAKNNVDTGDVFNSNTVFTHQFPKTIEEAQKLEKKDGGVNLFMHLEFDNGVSHQWHGDSSLRVLECNSCGKVVPNTPELMDIKNDQLVSHTDIDIGNKVGCNQLVELCNWKEGRINGEDSHAEGLTDLHAYFEKQGLLMKFRVESDTPLDRARVELLRKMAGSFKL